MKTSKIILIGVLVWCILLTICYTIIFCVKGAYPTEIYLANIPPIITELILLFKLKINEEDIK